MAAIPTSVFYADPAAAPPLARFCFAKSDETLRSPPRAWRLADCRRRDRPGRPTTQRLAVRAATSGAAR